MCISQSALWGTLVTFLPAAKGCHYIIQPYHGPYYHTCHLTIPYYHYIILPYPTIQLLSLHYQTSILTIITYIDVCSKLEMTQFATMFEHRLRGTCVARIQDGMNQPVQNVRPTPLNLRHHHPPFPETYTQKTLT